MKQNQRKQQNQLFIAAQFKLNDFYFLNPKYQYKYYYQMDTEIPNTNQMIQQPIEISDPLKQRIRTEKYKFKQLKQKFNQQFDTSLQMQYYLLSNKFIKQWTQFTNYDQNDLQILPQSGVEPKNYNIDILVNDRLMEQLIQNIDYIIVNKEMMDIFKSYIGIPIIRQAYRKLNNKKVIQIYKLKFKYFILSQKVCYSIDMGKPRPTDLEIHQALISHYVNLKQFKQLSLKLYKQKYKFQRTIEDIKIWKMDRELNSKEYLQYIVLQTKSQHVHSYRFLPKASLLERPDVLIQQFCINSQDIIIIQVRQKQHFGWVLKHGDLQQQCDYCRGYKILKNKCGCEKVNYCSQECKFKDLKFHRKNCSHANQQQLKQQLNFNFNNDSRRGITGLHNLGNTCFMNSCLQCLSNTQKLTIYFLEGRYKNQINNVNRIGTNGKLTVKYAKLIKQLWCGTDSSFSPYVLKAGISDFQPMFSGYSQHDSQELLSFLLDGIHEDLNRVLIKPYVDSIDSNQRPDQIVAKLSWEAYLKRNQSIIVDLFMGQYKSKVICPDCYYQSITFDPYSNISLPIPSTIPKETVQCFIFFNEYRNPPKRLVIQYTQKSVKYWRQYVGNILQLNPQKLIFYILTFDGEIQQFNDNSHVSIIKQKTNKQKLFCIQRSDQQMNIPAQKKIRIIFKFIKIRDEYSRNTKQTMTFKRPFYFNAQQLTGQLLYRRIFKLILKPVLAITLKNQSIEKSDQIFQKYINRPQKLFNIFLLTQKFVEKKWDSKYQIKFKNQKLIQFDTKYKDLLFTENGQISTDFQFQVRLSKFIRDQVKKLNTYQDLEKQKKNKNFDDEDCSWTLLDCFKQFRKKQKLQRGNQWFCPKCKQHKEAFKQLRIYKASQILVIHLKRFKQKSQYSKSKINAFINYPHLLDLKQQILNPQLPSDYFVSSQQMVSESTKYQLYAVSNHYGGMGGGHYTAFAKNRGEWYEFNDSTVRKVNQSSVISNAGYILFYKRI